MSLTRFCFALAATLLSSSVASAQYPADAVGFQWSSSSGATAGYFCWGFDCRPSPVRVGAGEQIELLVRADGANQPYVILASLSATQCLTIPGVAHALSLDLPVFTAIVGTLHQTSPILACPAFFDTYTFSFPAGLPSGGSFALQALTFGARSGALLSQSIVVGVI